MRWIVPKDNDRRVRRFFAWLPTTNVYGYLENVLQETRWLETVQVEEIYWTGNWYIVKFLPLES